MKNPGVQVGVEEGRALDRSKSGVQDHQEMRSEHRKDLRTMYSSDHRLQTFS